VSILLIQHDAAEAPALAAVLQEAGFQVAVDSSEPGAEVPAIPNLSKHDVIAIGAHAGFEDRMRLCRQLRSRGYSGAILAVSRDTVEVPALLDAGADDFLVAPVHASEFVVRIRMALRGGVSRVRARWGEIEIDRVERTAKLREQPLCLTAREYALLSCLLEASGEAVSRADLLARIWGHDEDPSSNLIEVHLSRLRDKLGADEALIETVRKTGYRLRR
jgi:DNA-binding response OmpR family regulator